MFGYYVLRVLTWPLGKLPLGFHRAAGRFLGWLAGRVVRYRRDVVMTNLSRSFPDKKYEELISIADSNYRHFCTQFCEAIWFGTCDAARVRRAHVAEIEDVSVINGFYDSGRGGVVLIGHSGNWELMGGIKSYSYGPEGLHCPENDLCVVYKRLSSKAWNTFMNRNRIAPVVDKRQEEVEVETFDVLRYVIRHRDCRKTYFFITDQSPYSDSSCIKVADFMHQSTWSMNGGPALAIKLGMPVVYMSMRRKADYNYTIRFIPICADPTGMTDVQILDRYYELLQEDIEAQPWNYLWTHKRWKK